MKKKVEYDKEVLLKMYDQAWELYKHEDNLCEERNSKFLSLSTAVLGLIGTLIAYATNKFESLYLSLLNNENTTSIKITACCSIVLIVIAFVFFIILLRNWEKVNARANDYVKVRYDNAKTIEKILKGEITDFNQAYIAITDEEHFLQNDTDGSKTEKGVSGNKTSLIRRFKESLTFDTRSGGFGTTRNMICCFRWFILVISLLMVVGLFCYHFCLIAPLMKAVR